MKNLAIVVLFVAAVGLGALSLRQTQKTIEAQTVSVGLQQKVAELQTTLEAQEATVETVRQKLETANVDAANKAKAAAQLQKQLQQTIANASDSAGAKTKAARPAAPEKSSNPMAAFGKMFNDPAMKDAIRTQQKTIFSQMLDKNYARLFSDLKLPPEQTSKLKELMLNKQLDASEAGMAMLSDEGAATNRLQIGEQINANNQATDAKIKDLLGEANYAQFQNYEKTMTDRMALSGFREQLSATGTPLPADQEQQLVDAMSQERQKFKFTAGFPTKPENAGDFSSMFNEEKMNQHFDEQEKLNQRYLDQAKTILSPAQFESFQKYLTDQQALQKASMQMAAKMFAPEKPPGE